MSNIHQSEMSFLKLMRGRFSGGGIPGVDPVPWELDDKVRAYEYVQAAGYRTTRYTICESAADAMAVGETMGSPFVVKQPNRHSTQGVYVLESLGNGRYLDLFSMREISSQQVVAVGPVPEYWLAEECVPSGVAGRPLPLDYKVYAFRGSLSHVVQIDRNVYPPRIAVFDGCFLPLRPGLDYATDPQRWLHEGHVLPRHAGAMLKMASVLSRALSTRFVRVDCYDGPSGPVFGEFTFASGPDYIGMLRYSPEVLASLDCAMGVGKVERPLSGIDIEEEGFLALLDERPTLVGPDMVLRRLAGGAIQGDVRYGQCAVGYLSDGPVKDVFRLSLNLVGALNGDESRAFGIQRTLRSAGFPFDGRARLKEFEQRALDFHHSRADGNAWHASRAAEIRLAMGERGALQVLQALADGGYGRAQRVVDEWMKSKPAE